VPVYRLNVERQGFLTSFKVLYGERNRSTVFRPAQNRSLKRRKIHLETKERVSVASQHPFDLFHLLKSAAHLGEFALQLLLPVSGHGLR
jgi:hypothetical protein